MKVASEVEKINLYQSTEAFEAARENEVISSFKCEK